MKLTRRAVSALLPAGLLAACSDVSRAPKRSLRDLIDGPAGHRAPAAGFVVIKDGEIIAAETVGLANGLSEEERSLGIEPRPFTPQTPFRAASISKLAVAMCCEGLHQMAAFDLDGDIRDHLDWMPRHPAFPDITITPRMLLSHTAGTRDPEAYWVPLPGQIQDIVSPDLFASPSRPGSWFEYCNLNYGLVATALEQATGQRFDRLVRAMVLAPLGLEGGFNWSDTDTPYRTNGATLYRETAEGWQIQMDGPDILNDRAPLVLKDEGAALSLYTPGTNGTLFSPQGGLRANLVELAQLA
ncbi:MAG: serine hydrolase domain-containing protein, partial [Pseudomonadota bacterium]